MPHRSPRHPAADDGDTESVVGDGFASIREGRRPVTKIELYLGLLLGAADWSTKIATGSPYDHSIRSPLSKWSDRPHDLTWEHLLRASRPDTPDDVIRKQIIIDLVERIKGSSLPAPVHLAFVTDGDVDLAHTVSQVQEIWALEELPVGTVVVVRGVDVAVTSMAPSEVAPDNDISQAFNRSQAYSAAVGARVSELIETYVEEHPDLASTPPEVLAEALVDVAVDPDADRSELADLLAPFWTPQRTAQALGGLTRQAMSDRRKSGSLLGVKTTDGDFFYPVAQFEAHAGGIRVKPDLRTFMMALRKRDPWTVAVLLHTPADELGGRTPLDWVRHGRDAETLVAYARLVNAEFER